MLILWPLLHAALCLGYDSSNEIVVFVFHPINNFSAGKLVEYLDSIGISQIRISNTILSVDNYKNLMAQILDFLF